MRTRRGSRASAERAALLAFALAAVAAGCDGESSMTDAGAPQDAGPEPSFPADFAASYVEMRDCRPSHEHELRHIRVLASPSALDPYAMLSPDNPYPPGAVLLKLEYDDELCAELVEYTSLEKLEPGASPLGGDWEWQRVSSEREVLESGAPWTCVNCHMHHCGPAGAVGLMGYDLTCAEER